MKWLFGNKAARRRGQAQVAVEGLEDRSLMAANFMGPNLATANALRAKDTIMVQELNLIQGIQAAKVNGTAALQRVIIDGSNTTNALIAQYTNLVAMEQQDRAAGDTNGVLAARAAEHQTIVQIGTVRHLMRSAVTVNNAMQHSLWNTQVAVAGTFNNSVNNLGRGGNPNLIVPHVLNAFTVYGQRAQQQANTGLAVLGQIDARINGLLPPPQQQAPQLFG